MNIQLSICRDYRKFDHQVVLVTETKGLSDVGLDKKDIADAESFFSIKGNVIYRRSAGGKTINVVKLNTDKEEYQLLESARKAAHKLNKQLNDVGVKEFALFNAAENAAVTNAFIEGMMLSNYQFLKYKTKERKKKPLASIQVDTRSGDRDDLQAIEMLVTANFFSRDLINEPLSFLTAVQLGEEIKKAGKKHGFSVDVLDKKKITALKMGGLLAVNRGSIDPPTFTIMEYKPSKAKNKKPVVLVGKGVVYDTGGLSLKPTPHSMDMMKCDMSGAAAVAGIFVAAAQLKLPIHLVGLIPATDNRPGMNAYVPGDVVEMMSGLNVEMLNADAEGRMILADALHYAKRYKPELVIDFATLTGAAVRAIGSIATAYMGTASDQVKRQLEQSSERTYERLIHFPLWDEYDEWIKSDVADIQNVGPGEAGHITAGKFLQHFVDYPWLHLDIAGTAYLMKEDSYRGKYGTAVGVRLITDFLMKY